MREEEEEQEEEEEDGGVRRRRRERTVKIREPLAEFRGKQSDALRLTETRFAPGVVVRQKTPALRITQIIITLYLL